MMAIPVFIFGTAFGLLIAFIWHEQRGGDTRPFSKEWDECLRGLMQQHDFVPGIYDGELLSAYLGDVKMMVSEYSTFHPIDLPHGIRVSPSAKTAAEARKKLNEDIMKRGMQK